MKTEQLELLNALGYQEQESNNAYMRSFTDGIRRVNVYTTGTIQIQWTENGKNRQIIDRNPSLEELEKSL